MAEELPQNLPELLSGIEREWKELWRVIARLTPEQMTAADAGGWSPKDNLAHLAEWLKILMGYHMDKRPPHEVIGVEPEVTKAWDMEVINPVLLARNQERPIEDVLDELKRTYAEVTAKLRSTPFETLLRPRQADDPEQRPLLDWVMGDTAWHLAEHRATIEKML